MCFIVSSAAEVHIHLAVQISAVGIRNVRSTVSVAENIAQPRTP